MSDRLTAARRPTLIRIDIGRIEIRTRDAAAPTAAARRPARPHQIRSPGGR
jgi:hypothetical protein